MHANSVVAWAHAQLVRSARSARSASTLLQVCHDWLMPSRTVAVELNARLYARYDLLGWRAPLLIGGLELEVRMPREPEPVEWERVEEGDVPYLRGPEGCDADLQHPSSFWGVSGSRLDGPEIDGILVSGLDQLPSHIDRDLVLDQIAMWSGRFIGVVRPVHRMAERGSRSDRG